MREILAGLFSLWTVMGFLYEHWHTLGAALTRTGAALAVLALGLLFLAYRFLIGLGLRLMERLEALTWKGRAGGETPPGWRETLLCFAFLMACYGVYLFLYYPGTLVPDGRKQLSQGLFHVPLTNMHPWLMSLAMGAICRLGQVVSDNLGFFLVVLTMAILEAACYALIVHLLGRLGLPKRSRICCAAFYGFYPAFGTYAQTLIKDGLAAAFTALFFALILAVTLDGEGRAEKGIPWAWPMVLATGALVCLTRRNGSYLVLACLVPMAVTGKRRLRSFVAVLLTILLLVANQKGADMLGVERASSRVYYSVIFQQTARTLRDFPEDLSKAEKKAIKGVLKVKRIGKDYRAELSDPVKNTFKEPGPEKIRAYLAVWAAMGRRHPLTYVDAFLEGCYGYYYPYRLSPASSPWYLDGGEEYSRYLKMDLSHLFPPGARKLGAAYAYLWKTLPPLKLFICPAFATWAFLFLALVLWRRGERRSLLPFLLPLMMLGLCTLCPVNGCLRYFLPVIASLPPALGYVLLLGKREVS